MKFVARRLLIAVGQVLLVTLLAYLLFYVISAATGASPAQRVAGHAATPAQIARVAHLLGTDKPFYVQYLNFVDHIIHGNFGYSFLQRRPVTQIILPAAGVSMSLILVSVVMWILMAVPIGLVAALHPRTFTDRFLTICAQVAIATPVFWLAPILSYLLAFEPNQGRFLGISLGTSVNIFPIEGWVSLTALLVPRVWRQASRVGAAVAAGALGVVLAAWVIRFTWSDPVPYALLAGGLLAFIVLAALAARPARVETARLEATSLSNVWIERQSFPMQRVTVNLTGPVGGDWSTDGRLRLVCESEDEAERLVAALQAAAHGLL